MKLVFLLLAGFAGLVYWMLFGETRWAVTELAHYPMDEFESVDTLHTATLQFDPVHSTDGNGSLRIDVSSPTLVELGLVEGRGENLSLHQLHYRASVKTQDVTGEVFLVMQAGIHGGMPVVGSEHTLTGSQDWTTLELAAGNPENTLHEWPTALQLDVRGEGTVWVDDVRLAIRQAK